MNIAIKSNRRLLVLISLSVSILFHGTLHAGEVFFPDCEAGALTVAEVDVDAGTAVVQSPHGETEILFVGDVIGKENFLITAIRAFVIELESPPDDFGRVSRDCIPVMPLTSSESLSD